MSGPASSPSACGGSRLFRQSFAPICTEASVYVLAEKPCQLYHLTLTLTPYAPYGNCIQTFSLSFTRGPFLPGRYQSGRCCCHSCGVSHHPAVYTHWQPESNE